MAKRRKRIRWGRVVTALAILGLVVFLVIKGITLLFGYISQIDLGNIIGNKNYVATVVIDPGHGGNDIGNSNNTLLEKDINLTISNEIAKVLEKNDIKAVLTRSEDIALSDEKDEDLAKRVNTSKDEHALYFISIHTNAYEGSEELKGYEIYTKNTDSEAISNSIINALKTAGFENSRGIYDGNALYVLRRNSVNALMIEVGYMNSSDVEYLGDEEKIKEFAIGIANGIVAQIERELGLNEVNTNE